MLEQKRRRGGFCLLTSNRHLLTASRRSSPHSRLSLPRLPHRQHLRYRHAPSPPSNAILPRAHGPPPNSSSPTPSVLLLHSPDGDHRLPPGRNSQPHSRTRRRTRAARPLWRTQNRSGDPRVGVARGSEVEGAGASRHVASSGTVRRGGETNPGEPGLWAVPNGGGGLLHRRGGRRRDDRTGVAETPRNRISRLGESAFDARGCWLAESPVASGYVPFPRLPFSGVCALVLTLPVQI